MKYSIILILLLTFCLPGLGQSVDPREAKEHFQRGNYPGAIKTYGYLLKQDPGNVEYNLNIAICYLKLNIDKTLALPHLEKVVKSPEPPVEAHFYHGMALQYSYKFDDAIAAFKKYLNKTGGNDAMGAKRQIETSENAKVLIKNPLDVTFENLGNTINSEYPDYYPLVPPDESFLVYTTRRKGGLSVMEFDGFYSSDIYYADWNQVQFKNGRSVGSVINTSYDEQAVGLSADGDQLFIYIDHLKEYGDIYLSSRSSKSFGKKEKMGEIINSKEFETSGSISADGEVLLFASRREGGLGGTDLYMTRKLPTGEWAIPQNLGSHINTYLNEDFPYMLPDGKTLYFASQGHSSMGGYDIFSSVWDEKTNTWTKPQNIGYPLNTPEDNMTIYFSQDRHSAYLSATRKEGLGDLDIYRVKFNDLGDKSTLIKCKVVSASSSKQIPAFITVTDPETEDLIGSYSPNPVTNRFVIVLPPGEYNFLIESDGHKIIQEKLVLFDHAAYIPELEKEFKLLPE